MTGPGVAGHPATQPRGAQSTLSGESSNGDVTADAIEAYNEAVIALAARYLPFDQPVATVRWIHIDQVMSNDYNPNSVARNEMRLLYISIEADGYTQPVVCSWDDELDRYVLVDGFHRYLVMKTHQDIYDRTCGYLPVVVIDKPPAERMASTVRHNRARGKHSVAGMSHLVFQMLQEGVPDADICNQLGLEAQELLRLKHITGFSKLLVDHQYTQAWQAPSQVRIKGEWLAAHPDDPPRA